MSDAAAMTESAASAMDGMYRHQRYIYDFTRRYYLIGRDQMIAELAPPVGGTVLEVGCGTARNLLRAARRYPLAKFYGLDVSEEMLKTARASIDRSPFRDIVTIAQADATTFSASELFGIANIDRIFISYALSMIPPWQDVIARAVSQLSPTGELHIVDFGTMATMPSLARRGMRAWLTKFSVTPRQELEDVVRDVARRSGRSAAFHHGRFDYAAHVCIGAKLS
ncbi:class I SAM-dependent methyltransferase [Hyphomicrobium sp. MC8b]|uniref:class I SAM-dependent methyltransferase n=1 Tax=Hyphomicrobium sp. MC8b TaxID=300273 RepID=UPI00391B51C8